MIRQLYYYILTILLHIVLLTTYIKILITYTYLSTKTKYYLLKLILRKVEKSLSLTRLAVSPHCVNKLRFFIVIDGKGEFVMRGVQIVYFEHAFYV